MIYLFFVLSVFLLITSEREIGGIRSYVVLTGSMEPAITAGSIIFGRKALWYPSGAIIIFKHGGISIAHRIKSIKNVDDHLFYQTQGDQNRSPDNYLVPEQEIEGAVVFHIPYIGRLVNILKTVPGFIFFIIIPGVAFIAVEISSLKKEMYKKL